MRKKQNNLLNKNNQIYSVFENIPSLESFVSALVSQMNSIFSSLNSPRWGLRVFWKQLQSLAPSKNFFLEDIKAMNRCKDAKEMRLCPRELKETQVQTVGFYNISIQKKKKKNLALLTDLKHKPNDPSWKR